VRGKYPVFRLKVKEVAKAKAMSQRQMFLRSGVDSRIVRKLIRNPYTVITVQTLERLARVLEVDVSQLIESIPEEQYQIEYAIIKREEEERAKKEKEKKAKKEEEKRTKKEEEKRTKKKTPKS
jgi:transcriptional regulator with XRE-family HTH domain